jgi:hypothetical protein
MEFKNNRIYFDEQDRKRAPLLSRAGDSVGPLEALALSEELHKHIKEFDELDTAIASSTLDDRFAEAARLQLAEITFTKGNDTRTVSHELDIYVESMRISDAIADQFYTFRAQLEQ